MSAGSGCVFQEYSVLCGLASGLAGCAPLVARSGAPRLSIPLSQQILKKRRKRPPSFYPAKMRNGMTPSQSYEQGVADDALQNKAWLKLEGRVFSTVAVICCAYATLAVYAVYAVQQKNHMRSTFHPAVDHEQALRDASELLKPFLSELLPGLSVMLALNLFLSAMAPTNLAAPRLRSKIVPLAIVSTIVDVLATLHFYDHIVLTGAQGQAAASSDAFVRRLIHYALAFYVIVVNDGYMVLYVVILQGYVSWTWYRLCMALDGLAFLVAVLLLHALGEEQYPPGDLSFVQSLARPTLSLLLAAVFNQPFRVFVHQLCVAAGFQHVPLDLKELKRDEVHSLIPSGWGPTAAGNSSRSSSDSSVLDCSRESSSSALRHKRSKATSHHTTKLADSRPHEHIVYDDLDENTH